MEQIELSKRAKLGYAFFCQARHRLLKDKVLLESILSEIRDDEEYRSAYSVIRWAETELTDYSSRKTIMEGPKNIDAAFDDAATPEAAEAMIVLVNAYAKAMRRNGSENFYDCIPEMLKTAEARSVLSVQSDEFSNLVCELSGRN